MSGSGRRAAGTRAVALTGLAAVLAVALLHGATAGAGGSSAGGSSAGRSSAGGADHPQAVVGEWTPGGAAPAAVRARGGADGASLAVVDLLRSRAVAASLAAAGLVAAAAAWWALARPDARVDQAARRTAMAPLRAPPLALA
jgi:hypothetical protein